VTERAGLLARNPVEFFATENRRTDALADLVAVVTYQSGGRPQNVLLGLKDGNKTADRARRATGQKKGQGSVRPNAAIPRRGPGSVATPGFM